MKHAKPCGSINNVFIDFENTQILVSNVAEVRVVSQMAAAYYNATLAQNLSGDKDLYGMPYQASDSRRTEDTADTPRDAQDTPLAAQDTPRDASQRWRTKTTAGLSKICAGESAPTARAEVTARARQQCQRLRLKEPEWDEELHGDRMVYDSTYEMNEHLVPWLMNPDKWEEKYGFY